MSLVILRHSNGKFQWRIRQMENEKWVSCGKKSNKPEGCFPPKDNVIVNAKIVNENLDKLRTDRRMAIGLKAETKKMKVYLKR